LGAVGDPKFIDVINTAGFSLFRVEETDGMIGQARPVFGNDFTFKRESAPPAEILQRVNRRASPSISS
jgi:hypothetical protein